MFGDNVCNALPNDDELVRRENLFLRLFDRYSIDEGDDAVLADLDREDETVEDDNLSGSSFSEASSIEGDNGDDDKSEIDEITKQLQPVIQDRVNAWPNKGINLKLKKVDPSVSVADWLKANQESTTTTKKYKKTVIAEKNKTITTTTKHTTTTTKKSTFNAFVPSFMAVTSTQDQHHKQIVPQITDKSIDQTAVHKKSKHKKDVSKKTSKGRTKVEKLPGTIELSKLPDLSIIEQSPTFIEPNNPSNRCKLRENRAKYRKNANSSTSDKSSTKPAKPKKAPTKTQYQQRKNGENSAKLPDPSISDESQTKSKRLTKRQYQKREDKEPPPQTESKKKSSPTPVMPAESGSGRCLRSRLKENIVPQVQYEEPPGKPSKTTQTKKQSKKQGNRIELPTNALQPTVDVQCEGTNEPVHRYRSPLKERDVNRNESQPKLRDLRVYIKKLPCPTRCSARNQKRSLDIANNDTNVNRLSFSNYDPTTANCFNFEPHTSMANRVVRKMTIHKLPPLQEIVIHSPNSDTLLGTKINDTTMVVTKNDYTKRIRAGHVRTTTLFDRSVIPINRRIIYQAPINDLNNDNTDDDSECEDVLLSSYMNSGRIVQMNL